MSQRVYWGAFLAEKRAKKVAIFPIFGGKFDPAHSFDWSRAAHCGVSEKGPGGGWHSTTLSRFSLWVDFLQLWRAFSTLFPFRSERTERKKLWNRETHRSYSQGSINFTAMQRGLLALQNYQIDFLLNSLNSSIKYSFFRQIISEIKLSKTAKLATFCGSVFLREIFEICTDLKKIQNWSILFEIAEFHSRNFC